MVDVIINLIRRMRPVEGWPLMLLGVGVALCFQQLAATGQIAVPSTTVCVAGLLGLFVGRLVGRWNAPQRQGDTGDGQTPRITVKPGRWQVGAFWATATLVLLAGSVFLALQLGGALPPLNLVWRDGGTFGRLITERPTPVPATPTPTSATRPSVPPAPRPIPPPTTRWDTFAFLETALPRFWQTMVMAPNNGAAGARFIAELASVLLAWGSLFLLGIALRRNGRLAVWSLPVVFALVAIKLLGGGGGYGLVSGLGLVFLLALLDESTKRERTWLAHRLDYASDLRSDMIMFGTIMLVLTLILSSALPFTFDNGLARWLWSWIEPPSGLAALERTINENDRPRSDPAKAQVAGSTLPSVALGQSLEAGSPEEEALRVRVGQPLPSGPLPVYWRSRILTIYTGISWYTNAIVTPDKPLDIAPDAPFDFIVQDIEDRRSGRQLIYALPNMIGLNVASNAERLPDGTLVATTLENPDGHYRVFSQPPLSVPAVERPDQQPDMTPYLQLPPDLPPRVSDLARTITRNTVTPEDSALALESYLRDLPYSYEVAPIPDRGDAVDQFLFSMRQGYCTYYASAFAVLARSLKIPARISLGYSTGSYDAATQTYTVHERDAHAWPELYINGRWVPFEPTPVLPLPARGDTQQAQPIPTPPVPAQPFLDWERLWSYWPGILVVLVLVIAVLLPWLPRLRPDYSPGAIQRQLERRGAQAGVTWPAGATIHEYATLLRPHLGPAAASLDTLVVLIEKARYSGQTLSSDQQGRLLVAWTAVKQHLNR